MAHPLFDDSDRLEQVRRVAHQKILKMLGLNPVSAEERVLTGGVSADDILQEVMKALWHFDPDELRDRWEALAVTFAHNKTVDALRRADHGTVSLDRTIGSDDDAGLSGAERLSDWRTAEDEYMAIDEELVVWEFAQEHLDERELKIFYDIHYLGRSRAEVGRELGLTGQRVGQIYARILMQLWELAGTDPRFSHLWDDDADDSEADPGEGHSDDEDDGEEGEA